MQKAVFESSSEYIIPLSAMSGPDRSLHMHCPGKIFLNQVCRLSLEYYSAARLSQNLISHRWM